MRDIIKLSWLEKLFLILIIISALTWGLKGFFEFELIPFIFRFPRVNYIIFGIAGVYAVYWRIKLKEDREIQIIRERFKPVKNEAQIFEYEVEDLKEKFIIEFINIEERMNNERYAGEPVAVIKISPEIYEEYDQREVFYLPFSVVSPQYDLKNALVNEFLETLRKFKDSLCNLPVEKPGIQAFIMLKILFLLDMPGICMLFLLGATEKNIDDFKEYKFIEDKGKNIKMVSIFSNYIGGFLRDKKVKAVMEDMVREKILDKWYDKLTKLKLKLLKNNFALLGYEKSQIELKRLKQWFFQRYDFFNGWQCIVPSLFLVWLWLFLIIPSPIHFFLGLWEKGEPSPFLFFTPILFMLAYFIFLFIYFLWHRERYCKNHG